MSDTARSRFGPDGKIFGGFGANPRFRGSLDDIALWTRALSETKSKGCTTGQPLHVLVSTRGRRTTESTFGNARPQYASANVGRI